MNVVVCLDDGCWTLCARIIDRVMTKEDELCNNIGN